MGLDRLSRLAAVLAHASTHTKPLGATFIVLFTLFVIGMVALIFLTVRYVIRRDRAGRAEWLERQVEQQRLAADAAAAAANPDRRQ